MGLFHLIKEAVMKMLNLKEIKKLGAEMCIRDSLRGE